MFFRFVSLFSIENAVFNIFVQKTYVSFSEIIKENSEGSICSELKKIEDILIC